MNNQNNKNENLIFQINVLKSILMMNEELKYILEKMSQSNLDNYYVATGCIVQSVWNYYHDFLINFGIEDIDITYFDEDTSYEKEDKTIKEINDLLGNIKTPIEVRNQARVHLWFKEKYGYDREPFSSLEDAVKKWSISSNNVAVRIQKGEFIVCAPFGLDDLFNLTVRPNKSYTNKEFYQQKTKKWKSKWPKLNIIPWDE